MRRPGRTIGWSLALVGAMAACEADQGRPLDLDALDAKTFDVEVAADPGPADDASDDVATDAPAPADTVTDDGAPQDVGGDDGADAAADVADAVTDTVDADAADAQDVAPDAQPPPPPPQGGAALQAWLEAGHYLSWAAESAPHASTGPHFGKVRTFVNAPLEASLAAGAAAHPAGAAAVKELYGSGDTVAGWAVAVKLQAASALGEGWHWYERYQGSTYADAAGAGLCTGCHSAGKDFILTPSPLK